MARCFVLLVVILALAACGGSISSSALSGSTPVAAAGPQPKAALATPPSAVATPAGSPSPTADGAAARALQVYLAQVLAIQKDNLLADQAVLQAVADDQGVDVITQRGNAYVASLQQSVDKLQQLTVPPTGTALAQANLAQERGMLAASKDLLQAFEQDDIAAYWRATSETADSSRGAIAALSSAVATSIPAPAQASGTPTPSPLFAAYLDYQRRTTPLTGDIARRDHQTAQQAKAAGFDPKTIADALNANLDAEQNDVSQLQQLDVPDAIVPVHLLLVASLQHSVNANRLMAEGLQSQNWSIRHQAMQEQARTELAQLDWSAAVGKFLASAMTGASTQ